MSWKSQGISVEYCIEYLPFRIKKKHFPQREKIQYLLNVVLKAIFDRLNLMTRLSNDVRNASFEHHKKLFIVQLQLSIPFSQNAPKHQKYPPMEVFSKWDFFWQNL